MTMLLATVAGSIGALGRYAVSGIVQDRTGSQFPTGTAAVNLIGAFLLGVVVGAFEPGSLGLSLLGGFFGGFTTFSTWMVESVDLGLRSRARLAGLVNLGIVLVAGVALAALGYNLTG